MYGKPPLYAQYCVHSYSYFTVFRTVFTVFSRNTAVSFKHICGILRV